MSLPFPSSDFSANRVDPFTGGTYYDFQNSKKTGVRGNFVDATAYYFCRQKVLGGCFASASYKIYKDYGGAIGWRYQGIASGSWSSTFTQLVPLSNFHQGQQAMVNSLKPKVIKALYSKVQGELADFDLLTEVVELGHTASLIKETAERLSKFVFGILKRKPLECLKALGVFPTKRRRRAVRGILNHYARKRGTVEEAAADIWLKYRYGFLPLLSSVNSSLDALLAYNKDSIVTRSQATIPDRQYSAGTSDLVSGAGGSAFKVYMRRTNVNDVSVRAYGYWTGLNNLVASIRGTRLVDFIQTGYEIMPFSFVLDWVWNLSDYLNNQRTDARISWVRGAFSIHAIWQEVVACDYVPVLVSSRTMNYVGGFNGKPETRTYRKSFTFKREPFSTPSEYLTLPDLDLAMSWKRQVDFVFFSIMATKGRLSRTWHY